MKISTGKAKKSTEFESVPDIISVYEGKYFENLHHKEYDIDRAERRKRLQETFLNWYALGTSYAVLRDNKDAQFARTKAIVNGKKVSTSYPLYQAMVNVVKRENLLCHTKCDKTCEKPCSLINHKNCGKIVVWWHISIPNFIALYRCGSVNPLQPVNNQSNEIVWVKTSIEEIMRELE